MTIPDYLTIPEGVVVKRGDYGPRVKLIQEWLCLQGHGVVIDSEFGPATEKALVAFQHEQRLRGVVDGVADMQTLAYLLSPMSVVLEQYDIGRCSLSERIMLLADKHLGQNPREGGGENCGPWVRLYMNGNEGMDYPWCAGFACFILKQACEDYGTLLPITVSFSSSMLMQVAKTVGLFVSGDDAEVSNKVVPGSFFCLRGGPTGYHHTGIVTGISNETIQTIEGNTNDSGSAEGYEVCTRTRALRNMDFIVFPA